MNNTTDEYVYLIVYVTLLIVILITFVMVFLIAYNKKKIEILLDKVNQRQHFEKVIINTRLEIQEHILKNLSWELHDNVGQLLSVAKMQLNIILPELTEDQQLKIKETSTIVGQSLHDVRLLSKTLNSEVLSKYTLTEAITLELERFNRLDLIEASKEVIGTEFTIQKKETIIIFRIFQEVFSNVIKHADATFLKVKLIFNDGSLEIEVRDDGNGFDTALISKGCGLQNMQSRAELINANLNIFSELEQGTSIKLVYSPKKEELCTI